MSQGFKEISFFPQREWLGWGRLARTQDMDGERPEVMEEVGTRHWDQRLGWSSRAWEKRPAREAGIHGAASWLGH